MLGMSGIPWMQRMMADATIRSEADFLSSMVAHHEEAVESARELRRSARPPMRRLGRSIILAQSREIRLMRSWLATWYPGTTPADEGSMMSELSLLEGDELDATFLREMIRHHMAAVMMSHRLVRAGLVRHAAVGELAQDIARTQSEEIRMMSRWLRAWSLDRTGHPTGP
jgi:uncharacterized protein (DUF305 family)